MTRGLALRPYDTSITTKLIALMGSYVEGLYQNKFYGKAQNLVQTLTKAYDKALETYDVLVMPTIIFKPTRLPSANDSLDGKYFLSRQIVFKTLIVTAMILVFTKTNNCQ